MLHSPSPSDDGLCAVPTWLGIVTHLHICPRAFLPMREVSEVKLVAGKGIVGDRYMIGNESGFHSHKREDGRQITIFEIEAIEAIKRDFGIDFAPHEHRRNVTVRGVPLNQLVGRTFQLGSTVVQATRLSSPCRHIEKVTSKPVFDAMMNRSGLHCRILHGGTLRVGDPVHEALPASSRSADVPASPATSDIAEYARMSACGTSLPSTISA